MKLRADILAHQAQPPSPPVRRQVATANVEAESAQLGVNPAAADKLSIAVGRTVLLVQTAALMSSPERGNRLVRNAVVAFPEVR